MELPISDEARIAGHNRYKCFLCRKRIMEGLPVIRRAHHGSYGYQSHSICHKCANRILEVDRETVKKYQELLTNVEENFNKLMQESSKALILEKLRDEKRKTTG